MYKERLGARDRVKTYRSRSNASLYDKWDRKREKDRARSERGDYVLSVVPKTERELMRDLMRANGLSESEVLERSMKSHRSFGSLLYRAYPESDVFFKAFHRAIDWGVCGEGKYDKYPPVGSIMSIFNREKNR